MGAKDAGLAKCLELLSPSPQFPRAVPPESAVHADWDPVITWLCQLEAVNVWRASSTHNCPMRRIISEPRLAHRLSARAGDQSGA